jgi:hypothetical protein
MRSIQAILLFLMVPSAPAHAAAAKATFYACTEQAVFKRAFERPSKQAGEDSKADKEKRDVYFKTKMASGECIQLARSEQLSVDQRQGNLWCVRPSGELNCYWTADSAIDLNPSADSSSSAQSRGSRRH